MPVLREPAGPRRPRLPPGERVPALSADPAAAARPGDDDLLAVLTEGELEVHGRLTTASNTTLYATVTLDGVVLGCVYKPVTGEKPLWDFPARTLARREVAAYELSAATGLDVVPPTVLRDGPFGTGSVQWWINGGSTDQNGDSADDEDGGRPVVGELGAGVVDVVPPDRVPPGWLSVLEAEDRHGLPVVLVHADDPALRRMALFDAVTNNTDRKGGHILRHAGGAIYGVDHGLTFNVEDKLRTVLWGWAGDAIDEQCCESLERLVTDLTGESRLRSVLAGLLADAEIGRTARRAAQLARRRRYPLPPGDWPAIPWPPF